MSTTATVKENAQILADAVGRNAAVVLSLPSAGLLHNHKTRFLGENEQGLWLEAPANAKLLLEELLAAKKPLAVSFHANNRRLSFISTVVQVDPAYRVNESVTTSAVQIAVPKEVKGVQRRSAYRVRVPGDSDLLIKVWQISNHFVLTDRPQPSQEVKVALKDISIGGVGVVLDESDPSKHKLVADQRLRIELRYNELELLLEGRLRNVARGDGKSVTGIVFKKLEGDLAGRQSLAGLTRIIGELSREEIRRVRRGA